MSEIVEILGEKKFAGSINTDLSTRLVFEETSKIQYENNLFYDISQQAQYLKEKTNSNIFRIYGKISPIMALDVYQKTTTSDAKIILDLGVFDFNTTNWSIAILKSKPFKNSVVNGVTTYTKGVKLINKSGLSIDFKRGLPAKFNDRIIRDKVCLLFPLNHNFIAGDKVRIDSINNNVILNGFYIIESVIDNKIIINVKPLPSESILGVSGHTQNVRGLTFNSDTLSDFNVLRPNIQNFINPEVYVSKILEKEVLEYYIKALQVVDIIENIDDCAFSINNFNDKIKNIVSNRDVDISSYINNKSEPISDIYIGVIKNGALSSIGSVESYFKPFIDFVSDGNGIETINQKINVGDILYHSLCEYTTEELTETEITPIYHRFIHRDILFNYNPFFKIQLKLKSKYIEDGDNKVGNIPINAIYSKQREKYIWRDIFDIGVADDDGNVLNFPFMNGSFYVFSDLTFFLNAEKRYVRKYNLNFNDINLNGTQLNDEINDILDEITITPLKPYNQYINKKC